VSEQDPDKINVPGPVGIRRYRPARELFGKGGERAAFRLRTNASWAWMYPATVYWVMRSSSAVTH
jgi:hypothetical protein